MAPRSIKAHTLYSNYLIQGNKFNSFPLYSQNVFHSICNINNQSFTSNKNLNYLFALFIMNPLIFHQPLHLG